MHWRRARGLLAMLAVVMVIWPAAHTQRVAAQTETCFPETGFCLSGRFRSYWEQNGGLAVFGFPVSETADETNRDTGTTHPTQWLERNRFELHPENQPPYDVLLGRLGDDRLLALGRPWQREEREAGPAPGCLWFPETRRNVCNQGGSLGFKRYWESHGLQDPGLDPYQRSLALFGLPLTAPRLETNASGDTVLTQWFERARFEWHPGKPDAFKVLLGLLGSEPRPDLTASSAPSGLTSLDGTLYFNANDGQTGPELWRSDGTAAATYRVKDAVPGAHGVAPNHLTTANGLVFFSGWEPATGHELWRSDGTADGTVLAKDIVPGGTGSLPIQLTGTRDRLFFIADDGQTGFELWRSDGTAAGTARVKDIRPGPNGSVPNALQGRNSGPAWQMTNVNDTLFFLANDGVHGDEVWKSDGTEAGTVMVTDGEQSPFNLTASGGVLYFTRHRVGASPQLWRTDGTTAGTRVVKEWGNELNPGASFGALKDAGGTLFFVIDTHAHGVELWKSDGTAAGTALVKDIAMGPPNSHPTPLASAGRMLFFAASDATGRGLWRSDGTPEGTILLSREPLLGAVPPLDAGGKVIIFAGSSEQGFALWQSDGTPGGTQWVLALPGTPRFGSPPPVVLDGQLFFTMYDRHGEELWRTDLTSAGTRLVKDINTNR